MIELEHLQGRLKAHLEYWLAYPVRRQLGVLSGEYSERIIPVTWPTNPDRIDFLNEIAEQNKAQTYLEIGCRDDECFANIKIPHKVGVDPVSGGTVRLTSDEFFCRNKETFDLIFIDGLHLYEQVLRDISNALAVLNPVGTIVLHDCLPLTAEAQYRRQCNRIWNGDVWKAMVEFRTRPDLDAATCLIDHGLGIIRPRPNTDIQEAPGKQFRDLGFNDLVENYPRWLRTMDYEAGLKFASK